MALITENVFILLLIIAYGSFFAAFYKTRQGAKSVGLYIFSTFFLIITAMASVPVNNELIGLINIPIAIIAAALALTDAPGAIWE